MQNSPKYHCIQHTETGVIKMVELDEAYHKWLSGDWEYITIETYLELIELKIKQSRKNSRQRESFTAIKEGILIELYGDNSQ